MEVMMTKTVVTGNTFAHKAKLKEWGFRWDADAKRWYYFGGVPGAEKVAPPRAEWDNWNAYHVITRLGLGLDEVDA